MRCEGLGDLGRNWLDAGDERIEKNIVQVCFVLNVGVGDMGQKAKPEGCESGDSCKYLSTACVHCLRAGTQDRKSLDGGGGIQSLCGCPCTD